MYATHNRTRAIGLALTTAMTAALLAGCATGTMAPRAEVSAAQAQQALAAGETSQAIRAAEAAVAADPRNAAFRMTLGNAYLEAGRFAAAAASFEDAMALGDNSPRAALSLALALNGQARFAEAASLLNDWQNEIAPADLGLAMALSGQPERGIHILTNAIRGGDNTVKSRQNLAYAYAVAGRWREARTMVAQDVPAGEVGARLNEWAQLTQANAYNARVAGLLGVPANVRDGGQPVHLALANHPGAAQLASEGSQDAMSPPLARLDPAPAPRMAVPASGGELPRVGEPTAPAAVAYAPAPAVSAPVAAAASASALPLPPAPASAPFAQAFAVAELPSRAALPVPAAPVAAYSQPTVQPVPAAVASASAPPVAAPQRAASVTPALARPRLAAAAPVAAPSRNSTHLVQLGSFASEAGARRAWDIYRSRYPELADREMVITQAVVNGRNYWRVSAGGFDRASSRAMCGRVDSTGGDGCISWAANSPLPGAVDRGVRLARR